MESVRLRPIARRGACRPGNRVDLSIWSGGRDGEFHGGHFVDVADRLSTGQERIVPDVDRHEIQRHGPALPARSNHRLIIETPGESRGLAVAAGRRAEKSELGPADIEFHDRCFRACKQTEVDQMPRFVEPTLIVRRSTLCGETRVLVVEWLKAERHHGVSIGIRELVQQDHR